MADKQFDCVNYVVTHKPYSIIQDDLYKVLCVGDYRDPRYLSDQDGISISKYNDRLNETTGLYWIWKNTSSEYAGLSHYRRFFCNNRCRNDKSRLDKERIQEILVDYGYDIIKPNLLWMKHRLFDNAKYDVGQDLTITADQVIYDLIRKRQPDYLDAYCQIMHGHAMYVCNLFVSRREIMDAYCEWLFSFITDAAEMVDVTGHTAKEKRATGYFSEMMWTLWLKKNKIRIFELPYEVTEEGGDKVCQTQRN